MSQDLGRHVFAIGLAYNAGIQSQGLAVGLEGKLADGKFYTDPVFGFQVPEHCEGVPDKVLRPAETWDDKTAYEDKYLMLASLFVENFKKFADGCPQEILQAGPDRDVKLNLKN